MHPNPIFRKTESAHSIAFVKSRSFGILSLNGEAVPHLAHVPFLLGEDGQTAELHLVRSNPIARLTKGPQPAVIAVSGPDSYISPDWYQLDDQVPTWNYVAVHLIGSLRPMPADELPGLLDRLSDHFESQLAPKPIWKRDKMSDGVFEKMLRMIQPFRFQIDDIQSTWKLNQNKTDAARQAAAEQVAQHGLGAGVTELSEFMNNPPSQE